MIDIRVALLAMAAAACAFARQPGEVSRDVIADLAPTGAVRAAINLGNAVLAARDAANGEVRGVSVDLARELGRRLGAPVRLVIYTSAGQVVDAAARGEWDVAFVAVDPARARDVEFSAPYLEIEGGYIVPANSPISRLEEVDREGVRLVVGRGSAYDLYLTREIRHAQIVRAPTSPQVTDTLVAQRLEVGAGVRQQLEADARRLPGLRLLDGRFMVIRQAMATPRGRAAGARYLTAFVEDAKASGFVAGALARHGITPS